jgi:hypothetical protein
VSDRVRRTLFDVLADPPGSRPPGEPQVATPIENANGSAGDATFYRYRDPHGRIVIVDSLARVPAGMRGSVESVVLARPPAPSASRSSELSGQTLHWPSFAAGAGCALLAALLWVGLRRSSTPLLRFSLLGGALLLAAGAYFGWLRQVSGQGGPMVASPAALIEDARSAVEKMNARTREQERVLRELESER